jgi:hypothetical protein
MTFRKAIYALLFISILTLGLGGCRGEENDRSKKPSEDWSRGILLGESNIKQPVALTVDADKRAHLVWHENIDEVGEKLHYVQLNAQGQILVDKTLAIDLPRPRRPQLLVDEENKLHLGWLSRSEGQQKLYHCVIDRSGTPSAPSLLSREGETVGSFQMYDAPNGDISVIWSGQPVDTRDQEPNIFLTNLQEPDDPTLVATGGIGPTVLVDNSKAHLVWLQEAAASVREVYYASLDGSQLTPTGGEKITRFEYAESATYHGPVLSADDQNLYVIWSIQNLGGGLRPTAAFAYYASFPKGKPTSVSPTTIKLPSQTKPDYTAHTSPYGYSELAKLPPQVYSTDFINAPSAVQKGGDEALASLTLIVESASKSFMQLAMVALSDNDVLGYQIINNTSGASIRSTLTADDDANLHMAWIDVAGFQKYDVYYATTAPEAKEWLDRTTPTDIAQGSATLIWGILSGLGIAFLALMWNVLPVFWMIVFYLISREEYLDRLASKINLVVAIALYIVSKAFFIPGLLSAGTPFFYLVPAHMRSALMIAIPIFILVLAIVSVLFYVRRREESTMFKAYLFFAITDGLLTAALYAPRFFSTES